MLPFAEHRSYSPGLPVYAATGRGFDFLAHWHPDVELCLVTEGSMTVGVSGERAELGPGDLAVVASNAIHHYQKTVQGSAHVMVIFRPEIAGYAGIWPQHRTLVKSFWKASETGVLGDLLRQILLEYRRDDEFRSTVVRGLITQLCGLLDRECTSMPVPPSAGAGAPTDTGPLRLRMAEAITFVRSRYTTDLTLEAVAAHVNQSPWYFSRCFHRSCGTGFKAYLNALRVEEASRLLATTDRTILDIALDCGFSGARSFHRAYRRVTGRAPRDV